MHAFAAAGAAFLVAVLWFDLMFDVQTRKHTDVSLPADVLMSISAYYRRVTTEETPMNRLISGVMLITLLAIGVEIAQGKNPRWIGWVSLLVAASAIALAARRTVRNAARLGAAQDSLEVRSRLARTVYHDHLYCFVAMVLVTGLQLTAAS